MTEPRCEVSTRCALRPYVTLWANGASAESLKPFKPVTATCRRHVAMLIEHMNKRSNDIRIKGITS